MPSPAYLHCRVCGVSQPLAAVFTGCPSCALDGRAELLEVRYDYAHWRGRDLLRQWRDRSPGVWAYHELLPLADPARAVSLVEGGTPLVRLDLPGPGRIWIKDETRNPTGAHKDRFQSTSISMARALGMTKVVASTTGNHGVSTAAYSARAGLGCLVFCSPQGPRVLREMIQFHGGRVAVLEARRTHIARLVNDLGWYPSTGLTPLPVGTPYGVEGYKTIAYELYFQLGERFPGRVVVPVASGDIFYGPWKGFQELRSLGADGELPRMVVAQSAECDPIVRGFRARAASVPIHPHPTTVALSIGDETAAAITLTAAYESNGGAEAVPDRDIIAAVRLLAGLGMAAEPSGAAGLAAALAMRQRGEIGADEDVVCIMTGAAVKWPDTIMLGVTPHLLDDPDPAAIDAWLLAADRAIAARASSAPWQAAVAVTAAA